MRVPSGSTDRKMSFIAVDATDRVTRETGLTSFTVYRSRDGGTPTIYTTPTIAQADATNMPGLYWLTLDEDTTLSEGHDEEEYIVRITATGMAPVERTLTIFRPKLTEGQTVTAASGAANANVDLIKTQSVTCAAGVTVLASVGTAATSTAQTGDAFARLGAPAGASVSADIAAAKTVVDGIKVKSDFLPSVAAGGAGGLFIAGTNAATTITGALTTTFTGNLTGSVQSVSGNIGGNVAGSVGSVSGNVVGSVGSIGTGGITSGSFAPNSITAAALASDAVTEIQGGLATSSLLTTAIGYIDTEIGSILQVTNKLDSALEADGGVYRFTLNALELAPSGGGGGGGDATLANQTLIIGHLTDIKGAGWISSDNLHNVASAGGSLTTAQDNKLTAIYNATQSGPISFNTTQPNASTLVLYRGHSYLGSPGYNRLSWTVSTALDLTDAAAAIHLALGERDGDADVRVEVDEVVVVTPGVSCTLYFKVTAAQVLSIDPTSTPPKRFEVQWKVGEHSGAVGGTLTVNDWIHDSSPLD